VKITERGVSQVVFGFLPEQTVDLNNRVWRVKRWSNPNYVALDQDLIRREILGSIRQWDGRDNDLAARLIAGMEVHVVTPSSSGVEVDPFPRVFKCKACGRLEKGTDFPCKCKAKVWVAFPFVTYHACGLLQEPYIDVCPTHKQVRVNNPQSNNSRDLRFTCPVCSAKVQEGFRWINCDCGHGTYKYNVHRAGAVFNPHSTVIVNPPDETVARKLRVPSARIDTLNWILSGMTEERPLDESLSFDTLVEMFTAKGVTEVVARSMAEAAASKSGGVLQIGKNAIPLSPEAKERAAESAVKIAYATSGGRTTFEKLIVRATEPMKERYENDYPEAVVRCGLQGVELLDDFPVLTAYFGYTRDDSSDTPSHLRWYKDAKGSLQLYGLRARTEALMFTLDPRGVASWMHHSGLLPTAPTSARDARLAILEACEIPYAGDATDQTSPGARLLELVHSYSHRMIRTIASFAGTDRDGLAEYLVPAHLTFIIYARSTSDFVLGGLQALFENDLNSALQEFLRAETRCPLDPGCMQNGGACMACLHTGEPSCRNFNQYLARPTLFGASGYLTSRRHVVT